MLFHPHDYQQFCIDFIESHPVAALFLDMGLGKTVTTLTAINNLIFDSFEISRVLVIAPLRVARDTWPAELSKWDHLSNLSYSLCVGDAHTRLAALNTDANIYIVNREMVEWLLVNKPASLSFDMVVIDELSSFKNHRAKRFKALRKLISPSMRTLGLTGTPAPNGLMDLFGEIGILDGGAHLGRFITHFRDRYFNHFGQWDYTIKSGAEEEIYSRIADMSVSMKAIDYLDMPDLVSMVDLVYMSPQELKLYKKFRDEFILTLEDEHGSTIIDGKSAATLSGKLTQLANGFLYDEDKLVHRIHSHKTDALLDIIEEANGQPVLVAYWYKADLDEILSKIPSARLIDSPSSISDWNCGKIPVALIHPASAGHGLNLQSGGHILVWYGLTWSLELYEQTIARLYRQGQSSSTVVVRHILTRDSYDQRIMKALASKDMTQAALMAAVRAEVRS